MLRGEGLAVRFGAIAALDGVDVCVGDGERVAVLGPSGCGKTTLLRAVAGLEQPAQGKLEWDGKDLLGVPPHRRRFGLMFQDNALFPHRDVYGNVAFGLRMQGLPRPRIETRVGEVLEMVGLAGYERRAVGPLSGGEQQRVALARSLAPQPRLLMLDEPLGSLDRALRDRLVEELRELFARLCLSVLYVTHDQEEAFAIADRVVLLRAGRVEAVATPQELWEQPPNEWVARFLGFSNIAPATISGDVADTPWGRIAIANPVLSVPAREVLSILLRPDGFSPSDDGPIRGIVAARSFRGDHVRLLVEVPGAPSLEVAARWKGAASVGEPVRLSVEPGAVVPLPATATLRG